MVIDTGVILSRVIRPASVPAQAFEATLLAGTVLVSEETLEELKVVLFRPKFDAYLPLDDRLRFFTEFVETVESVIVKEQVLECRDSRDNKFLEVALNGGAKTILTGDSDLLVLHPWRGVSILTPAQYLAALA